MNTPAYTLLDETNAAEFRPPRNGPYQVYPEVYYAVCVSNANPFPFEPLVLRQFRVAEAEVRVFYDVLATTPVGAWDGPPQYQHRTGVRFRGSEPPPKSTNTPEGAILQYWRDLGYMLGDAENAIAHANKEIAVIQERRSKATHDGYTIRMARRQIEQRFRTIPEVTDDLLMNWIDLLPQVIPVDEGKYARVVPPEKVRTESILGSILLKSAECDLRLTPCGTHLVYAKGEAGPTLSEVYACIAGHVPNDAEFFRIGVRADSGLRVCPDPHQPGGYCSYSVVFLRTTQPGDST